MSDASDFIGNPLWIAISRAISEREYEIVKCMVAADNHVLRSVPSEGSMESILGHLSSRFKPILVKAVSRPPSESMEQVLQYSNEDSVGAGGKASPAEKIGLCFRLFALLVQADYHGAVRADDEGNAFHLHACAGCRDPYLQPAAGFLSLALRFYPGQLMSYDSGGNCPLHIAVSTVNRCEGEYYEDPFGNEEDEEDRLETARDEFYTDFCHHHQYEDFDQYVEDMCECDCDREGEKFSCDCTGDDDWNVCCQLETYLDKEEEKCNCWQKFEEEGRCDCDEKFDWWYDKMFGGDHRLDKKEEIEMIVKAEPKTGRIRNQKGFLPLHLAIENDKCWEGGIQALVEAFPDALAMRDPVDKLYPFQLAAYSEDVDTTFELLRVNNNVLFHGTKKRSFASL